MTKIIEIKNCLLCPYSSNDYKHCTKYCKKQILDPNEVGKCLIPSWCPLPDKPEVKEKVND